MQAQIFVRASPSSDGSIDRRYVCRYSAEGACVESHHRSPQRALLPLVRPRMAAIALAGEVARMDKCLNYGNRSAIKEKLSGARRSNTASRAACTSANGSS